MLKNNIHLNNRIKETFPFIGSVFFCIFVPHEQDSSNRLWKKAYRNSCERYNAADRKRIDDGLTTVPTHELLNFIGDYIAKEPVERIIVGLPRQMNNEVSENMKNIEPLVRSLKKRFPDIPVEYVDERFTSVLAHRTMQEAGLKKKDRQNKALVDEISATIILQTYLESKRF